MSEFPVVLVSPDGREYSCHNAVELNNLVNSGYVGKTENNSPRVTAATETAPESAAKSTKAVPESRPSARDPK